MLCSKVPLVSTQNLARHHCMYSQCAHNAPLHFSGVIATIPDSEYDCVCPCAQAGEDSSRLTWWDRCPLLLAAHLRAVLPTLTRYCGSGFSSGSSISSESGSRVLMAKKLKI
jgi:hypothetical protein